MASKKVHKSTSRKSVPQKNSLKFLIKFKKLVKQPKFPKVYGLIAVIILIGTTVYWALLGAKIQQGNADQLISPYLFEHWNTYQEATFPGQHTFLIKWPLFLLVRLFGYSNTTFDILTVGIVLLTVGLFAWILYKIDRRPIIFGTLCLALASVLLLVPAQPYSGALLPVNMAMLTTRNIEYIIYIVGLICLIKAPRIKSWLFAAATVMSAFLVASDKLFLYYGLGGAFVALIIYSLRRKWAFVSLAVRWMISGLVALAGSELILWYINFVKPADINTSLTGPQFVHSISSLLVGIIYSIFAVFTNFGANPAYDSVIIRNAPHQFINRIFSFAGPSYLINIALLVVGLIIVYRLLKLNIRLNKENNFEKQLSNKLSTMLLWTTAAAIILFVGSTHYYAVDARYLTISVFAIFITAATYFRKIRSQTHRFVLAGLLIAVSVLFGLFATTNQYHSSSSAVGDINARNEAIVQIFKLHPTTTLVGNYWRVIPTKQLSKNTINVAPLLGCTEQSNSLTSTYWQPDLSKTKFAYLLTYSNNLANYPKCTLDQVISAYGKPNDSILVAGSISQPEEEVLFYDHGKNNSAPLHPAATLQVSTVIPIALNQLPSTTCSVPTILNVVAHQDDDLLFMNPDLSNDIKAGRCIRTVYITSGDTAVALWYDEDTPIPNVFIAPTVKHVVLSDGTYSHYSLLRSTEEILGLPFLGKAANAPSMRTPYNF